MSQPFNVIKRSLRCYRGNIWFMSFYYLMCKMRFTAICYTDSEKPVCVARERQSSRASPDLFLSRIPLLSMSPYVHVLLHPGLGTMNELGCHAALDSRPHLHS